MIAEAAILVLIVVLLVAIVVSSRRRRKRLTTSPAPPGNFSEVAFPSSGPGSSRVPSFPSPASAPAPRSMTGALATPSGSAPDAQPPAAQPASTTAPLPAAGTPASWLPDPGGTPGTLRYWDGHAWTDYFAQRA